MTVLFRLFGVALFFCLVAIISTCAHAAAAPPAPLPGTVPLTDTVSWVPAVEYNDGCPTCTPPTLPTPIAAADAAGFNVYCGTESMAVTKGVLATMMKANVATILPTVTSFKIARIGPGKWFCVVTQLSWIPDHSEIRESDWSNETVKEVLVQTVFPPKAPTQNPRVIVPGTCVPPLVGVGGGAGAGCRTVVQ
jgi:hypothetical protein